MKSSIFNLSGRTALVTGSSRGIGASIALAFAEAGASVAIHASGASDRAMGVAGKARDVGVKAEVISKDLADDGAAKYITDQVLEKFGKLDILVLNASVQIPQNWLSVTRENLEKHVAVNFRASLELLQNIVPIMEANRWGRILSIGSVQEVKPHPDMLVYSALKKAQTGMVVSLSSQLAPRGITMNNLAPGVILTDRNEDRLEDADYAQNVLSRIPVGCFGEPKDCAGAALLLCSEAGRYITGQSIFVDGGMSL